MFFDIESIPSTKSPGPVIQLSGLRGQPDVLSSNMHHDSANKHSESFNCSQCSQPRKNTRELTQVWAVSHVLLPPGKVAVGACKCIQWVAAKIV